MLRENLSAVCLQDFGEYQESYYSVQTTEGEQISQLIAGYIDIILKKVRLFSRSSLIGVSSQSDALVLVHVDINCSLFFVQFGLA